MGLFPGEHVEVPSDDRSIFRFEAAWDSSLHNSPLLNRISGNGEQVFMTISAYLEVQYTFYTTFKTKVLGYKVFLGSVQPASVAPGNREYLVSMQFDSK